MPRIGIISDTHGLLRPAALLALADVDQIIHAGDIGDPDVIEILQRIAPVAAVRGNVDRYAWADQYPETLIVPIENARAYVLHDLGQLDVDPARDGFALVVSGHSHRPKIFRHKGVLYVNPGSAGPVRFGLPPSVAELVWDGDKPQVEIIQLADR